LKLWGREAVPAEGTTPAVEKVEGVEEKMRKAEKALNQAYNQQNKAE
jgi:hypothetical protein